MWVYARIPGTKSPHPSAGGLLQALRAMGSPIAGESLRAYVPPFDTHRQKWQHGSIPMKEWRRIPHTLWKHKAGVGFQRLGHVVSMELLPLRSL